MPSMTAPAVRIAHPSPAPRRPRQPRRQDAATALLAAESESGFRHWLQDLLTATGWLWSYIPISAAVQGHRGEPDIRAVRGDRLLFIETKTARGKLSAGQINWAAALLASGRCEFYLWRPSDRAKIEQALR